MNLPINQTICSDALEAIGFYTLTDKRARETSLISPLWRCELLLTSKCNFHCPYCRGTQSDADISLDYAKHIIDLWAADNLQNVRFSGGEPTCVDWLPELISYTKQKGISRIAISTNGSKATEYYVDLYNRGVNDFSISLDACCSAFGDIMSGVRGAWGQVVENIRALSRLTYVTTGCVFDERNIEQSLETVMLAHNLGVADIRIITAAQFDKAMAFAKNIPSLILAEHPILKYRVNNFINGKSVRGIKAQDNHHCPLVLDDMAIRGRHHYPCIIYMREGGAPIGKVSGDMREERGKWYQDHDCFNDNICRENCLDVCIDYNNKAKARNTRR
ncbi:MAG: radical SAM protein [Candidatus Peribacteraceae bacterium]|nr:radical SAM protein [Candidatus Peribacteraceae bacterium]